MEPIWSTTIYIIFIYLLFLLHFPSYLSDYGIEGKIVDLNVCEIHKIMDLNMSKIHNCHLRMFRLFNDIKEIKIYIYTHIFMD